MNIRQLLSEAEFAAVTERNNTSAAAIVSFDWLVIALTFVAVDAFTNPLTILLAIFILGARQLGLGITVHEAGHRTLFKSSRMNKFAGNWLSGYWVFSNMETYMREHLAHHKNAGTADDPDLSNYKNYPISRNSFRRKIVRDLSGQVGWRRIKSIGRAIAKMPQLDSQNREYLQRSLAVNLAMFLLLTVFLSPWLYLLWVGSFMTSHMMVVRIRQIGEHAGVTDLNDIDPRKNTRTLYVNWLERLFIAPHHVSYHLEHHLLASVPIYNLEKMHRLLLQKGYYQELEFQYGYASLLKQVVHG